MENIFADADVMEQLDFFSVDCSIGYVYSTSIRNKNANYRSFLSQNNAYQIEEVGGKFIYGVNKINKHFISLQ